MLTYFANEVLFENSTNKRNPSITLLVFVNIGENFFL